MDTAQRDSTKVEIAAQISAFWAIYRRVVTTITREEWGSPAEWYLTPARLAFHIPLSVAYYIDYQPEFRETYEGDWHSRPVAELPDPGATLTYSHAVADAFAQWNPAYGASG